MPRLEDKVKEEKLLAEAGKRGRRAGVETSGARCHCVDALDALSGLICRDGPQSYTSEAGRPGLHVVECLAGSGEAHRRGTITAVSGKPVKMAIFDKLAADLQLDGGDAQASKKGPRPKFKPPRKAIAEFKGNELGHKRARSEEASACCPRMNSAASSSTRAGVALLLAVAADRAMRVAPPRRDSLSRRRRVPGRFC